VELLYTGIIGFARTLFKVQGLDITMRGERNFPAVGGAVVVINHTGYFDFVYGGIPARVHKRFIRYMAKVEVFDHAVAGPIMRELKHIPVDRTAGTDSFKEAVNRLRAGELVGVFPEATISRSFEIKGFKSGAVRMALEAGVPILPVTIWGSQRVWTKGLPKKLLRPKVPIIVEVGSPMQAYEPVDECVQELRARMQSSLELLQDEYARRYGPYPAGAPWVPARLGGSAPTLEEATALDEAEQAERMRRRAEKAGTADADDAPKGPAGPDAP
jgi:1-acyl-sn-glycerol-3-phosphate acyltransferase